MLPDKAVEDAKSAMRWVRANAARLGIDPNRIVSCGGSSGGHLAASVAALEDFDSPGDDLRISARPNAMLLHYPLLDFLEGGTRTTPFLDALGRQQSVQRRVGAEAVAVFAGKDAEAGDGDAHLAGAITAPAGVIGSSVVTSAAGGRRR